MSTLQIGHTAALLPATGAKEAKLDAANHPIMPGLRIERAQAEDAHRLTTIALAAKRSWGYPEAWMEAWQSQLTITADFVAVHPTFAARVGAGVVGFCALDGEGDEWELVHLWIEPDWMGRGIGRSLFAHGAVTARAGGAQRLRIEADPHAEGFYLAMGAQRIGEHIYTLAGTPRILPILQLQLWDRQGIRTPTAGRSRSGRRPPDPGPSASGWG